MPWEMSTVSPGSEADDGEEVGNDDASDWQKTTRRVEGMLNDAPQSE